MHKVLFVCLGNICRSPTAHGVLEHKLNQRGIPCKIDSCGTGAWHVGSAPDERSVAAAKASGYDLTHLRARQLSESDFQHFDYILAMDARNLADVIKMAPQNFTGVITLFLDYASDVDITEVPDPYHGKKDGFNRVIQLIEQAADGLMNHLEQA